MQSLQPQHQLIFDGIDGGAMQIPVARDTQVEQIHDGSFFHKRHVLPVYFYVRMDKYMIASTKHHPFVQKKRFNLLMVPLVLSFDVRFVSGGENVGEKPFLDFYGRHVLVS